MHENPLFMRLIIGKAHQYNVDILTPSFYSCDYSYGVVDPCDEILFVKFIAYYMMHNTLCRYTE